MNYIYSGHSVIFLDIFRVFFQKSNGYPHYVVNLFDAQKRESHLKLNMET